MVEAALRTAASELTIAPRYLDSQLRWQSKSGAWTALLFGANVLFGGIGQKGVLPLADNPGIRRQEITGLVQRALREPWLQSAGVIR